MASMKIRNVAISRSRYRRIEKNNSDLDRVMELSTNERADDLLNEFNNANGMY